MMKFTFNFEKKHLYILAGLLVIFGAVILAKAALNVDTTKPWHNLQQVARSATSSISVDVDGDGTMDFSEQSELAQIAEDANGIKGKNLYWDSTSPDKLCYNDQGTCTTVSATCPAGGYYGLNLNLDPDEGPCSDTFCDGKCKSTVKCNGDSGTCAGTRVNYNIGTCAGSTCGNAIQCRCLCSLSTNAIYSQATLSGTKKCATFASTP